MKRRALISVSDKTGIAELAAELHALDFELISTGGTARVLREAGLTVLPVSSVTGSPEAFDGRVKTLHPSIHGAILFARDNAAHQAQRRELGIEPIDLVVVNLYPFRETIAREGVRLEEAVEQIDIGGPTMVRAAAKNFAHVGVVVDPGDYEAVLEELRHSGALSPQTRQRLALTAFSHTASYDAAIAGYLARQSASDGLPATTSLHLHSPQPLRYGENPHQPAALYTPGDAQALGGAVVIQGKALSYNNLVDTDAALAAVAEHDQPAAVVVKHTNPCGVGTDTSDVSRAFERALAGDPQSAFGGIVALNRPCDGTLAARLATRFLEVVAAPAFTEEALDTLGRKKNLRLLRVDASTGSAVQWRWTCFGVLAQHADPRIGDAEFDAWRVATTRAPSTEELEALRLMWRVCKHVKSNAIVIGSNRRTYGVGAGQMSRVDAVQIALSKRTDGEAALDGEAVATSSPCALASDAFFPFRDSVDIAAANGITAIVQPGGSRRDQEVIDAANVHGIAMVMTGRRHFKH